MATQASTSDAALTAEQQALCAGRSNNIDWDGINALHYLGNYERRIPVSLTRMMENVHDWEHLPFVHASSFGAIYCIDSGRWGWRAKIDLPEAAGGGEQLIDLLADNARHYWATTVFNGMGEGVQIHTQATALGDDEIAIDVRFYLPEAPPPEQAAMVLTYLQQQYHGLYDEDEALMRGRQDALDAKRAQRDASAAANEPIRLGATDAFDPAQPHTLSHPSGTLCLRHHDGGWIAHDAVCPHLLGPLDGDTMDADAVLTCPWHGYRFNAATGESLDGQCGGLKQRWTIEERDGALWAHRVG